MTKVPKLKSAHNVRPPADDGSEKKNFIVSEGCQLFVAEEGVRKAAKKQGGDVVALTAAQAKFYRDRNQITFDVEGMFSDENERDDTKTEAGAKPAAKQSRPSSA